MRLFAKKRYRILSQYVERQEKSMMNVSSIAKGVAVGMTAGVVTYAITNATKGEKRRFRSSTMKAMRSVSSMMDILGAMFM